MSTPPVIAVDLGGTKIAAGIVDGSRVDHAARVPTPARPGIDDLVEAVASAVARLPDVPGPVAVATAGLVRDGALRALNDTFAVPDWHPFQAPLQKRLGRPVSLLNDAQAATWGEYRHGAGRGAVTMAFVTLSTGIGGGIVANGRLLTGHQGLAGSFGQMRLDPGDASAPTLEALASGSGLARRAAAVLSRPVEAPEVFASEDPAMRGLAGEMARLVAGLTAALAAVLDPDVVVIGGGVGLAPGVIDAIEAALGDYPDLYRPALRPAALGHEAGLVGVADWSLQDGR